MIYPDVIIIKGAPCSGKSCVAKVLSGHFEKGVRLEIDNLRSMVISPDWTNQQEHISILNLSINLVSSFLGLGYNPILVIDTFSGDKLSDYLVKLKETNPDIHIKVFGLVFTEEILKIRLEKRADEKFKDFDVCLKLNSEMSKFKLENETHIDTSCLTEIETANKILNLLS